MLSLILSVLFHVSYICGIFFLGYVFGKRQSAKSQERINNEIN